MIIKRFYAAISKKIFKPDPIAPKALYPLSDGTGPTPDLKWTPKSQRTGLIALKIGMTHLWDEWGVFTPLTVLKVMDCEVIKTRLHRKSGHYSLEVGALNVKNTARVRKPQLYHFRRNAVPPKKKIVEFQVSPDACLPSGTVLSSAHFVPGQYVDTQSKTLGKGFQGVMKRWGFKGLPASHGTSLAHRSPGSIGNRHDPGKVWKGKKMPGRMGGVNRTVHSLQVFKVDTVHNLIYLRGCLPGVSNAFVKVRDSVRKGWHQEAFPPNVQVPFPTMLKSVSELPRELSYVPQESRIDPCLRQRNERN